MRPFLSSILIAGLLAPTLATAGPPLAVSPGSDNAVVAVDTPCPTFSWGLYTGAQRWRLAVYRVVEATPEGLGPGTLVMSEKLPGVVHSWTPSLERCLQRGETYAWSIGSVGRRGKIAWSEPRIFRVAENSRMDVEEAIAIVGASRGEAAEEEMGPASGSTPEVRRPGRSSRGTAAPALAGAPRSPLGPVGNTALDMGGNLRLATSAPTIRLDDPAQTWDIVASSLGLFFADATGGGTQLSIFNGAPTGAVEVKSTGLTIKNDLICTDCIQSGDIQNGSILSEDIAPNSLGASKLATSSVGFDELARIYGVSVECDGECGDSTPLEACQILVTSTGLPAEPIAIACADPNDYAAGSVACGGDNTCFAGPQIRDDVLSICDDTSGFDLVVWCLVRGDG